MSKVQVDIFFFDSVGAFNLAYGGKMSYVGKKNHNFYCRLSKGRIQLEFTCSVLSTLAFITLGDHLADPTTNGPDSYFMEEEADVREAASNCWSGTEAELTPRSVGSLPSYHHTQDHALRIKDKIHLTKEAEMCTPKTLETPLKQLQN